MNKFSQAFKAAQEYVQTGDLAKSTLPDSAILRIKGLLAQADGPAAADAAVLDTLRDIIAASSTKELRNGVTPNSAKAMGLMNTMKNSTQGNTGTATLKTLAHLYLGNSVGGQTVWIYSPPKAYLKWIYDELEIATSSQLENKLALPDEEIFSNHHKEVMCESLQQTRAMSMDIVAKLGSPNDSTVAVVKQYFSDASSTESSLKDAMEILRAGFQKIAGACNSNKVIMSDDPIIRNGPNGVNFAFIYPSEQMNVIYILNAWLNKADEVSPSNQSALHRCVRTIIHELSHKEVGTEDIAYGPMGLNPNISSPLTANYALHNADSWAHFALDILGMLTGPDLAKSQKRNMKILKTPARTLKV